VYSATEADNNDEKDAGDGFVEFGSN